MSEKNSYKRVQNEEAKPNSILNEPMPWRWFLHEKKLIIFSFAVYWCYFFMEYLFMNLKFSEEIKGLSDGFFGFKRDSYDIQWNSFRENLPLIMLAAIGHLTGSHLIKKYIVNQEEEEPNTILLTFHLGLGIAYLVFMFEAGIIFWLILVIMNYICAKLFSSYFFYEPFLWICTVTTLYCNETYHGYKFVWIHPSLDFLDQSVQNALVPWHIMFNMTILRLMSFCLDFSWATRTKRGLIFKEHEKKCKVCNSETFCYKSRQEAHSPLTYYNFLNYISFLVYPALFISGPVTTFNAWISQIKTPQNTHTQIQVFKYVIRTFINYICFEIFLHCFYVSALGANLENQHIWQNFSLRHLGVMSFLEMIFLWFKFLLIWRIPRAWALLDGIEVPENMNRCVFNNHTFEGFWRSWHRGFNQWLIRYLFIPLGGSRYKLYNIWVVFLFVAIWHDMNINLVVWAWVICLALMPEMLIKWYFNLPKYRYLWEKVWWKYVCSLAGGVDVFFMVSANLIGFGIGWNGILIIFDKFKDYNDVLTFTLGYMAFGILLTLNNFVVRDGEIEEKGF